MNKTIVSIDGKQLNISIYVSETMPNHKTIYVDIEDENGICTQPLVAVEQGYNLSSITDYRDPTPHLNTISVKVWDDPKNEDFTKEHIIDINENPWEDE